MTLSHLLNIVYSVKFMKVQLLQHTTDGPRLSQELQDSCCVFDDICNQLSCAVVYAPHLRTCQFLLTRIRETFPCKMSALLRVARLHASWSRGTMRGHCFRYLSSETSADSQPAGGGRWIEAIDPATGFTFWYNEQTMEHRDKRPVEYNYQSFQDKPVDSKVKLVRGLDGRMWET